MEKIIMGSVVYNYFKQQSAMGVIDLDTDDIRARLLMTNTTCDTENDGVSSVANFTTLDESDATGYSIQALTGEVVNLDDGNDRAEFDADNVSFAGMSGDATRDYQGVLIVKYVDGAGADIPIAFIEFTNQPLTSTATQLDIPWDAEGILQLT